MILFAGANAFLDDLPVEQCRAFEAELYRFVENTQQGLLAKIREQKKLDDALRAEIQAVLQEVKTRFVADQAAAASARS